MPADTAEEDDETLNLRIQCQERDALVRLLQLHGPKAKGYLRNRYGFCDADIDAVLFEAADRAWRYGHTFDPKRSLKSWFLRIVQRQAVALITERKERREVEFSLDKHDRRDVCEDLIDKRAKQRIDALDRCIDKLPPNQQAIIRADLASDDVADAARLAKQLGSTANSIYASRNKAKTTLKKCVEIEMQQPSKGAKS